MNPRVTNVRETSAIGSDGKLTTRVIITYWVGSYGPFSLTTTAADIQSGAALQAMQNFANTLGTLPAGTAS